jgi:thiamine biosynthesis protein ThiI
MKAREYEARLDVEGLIQRAMDGIEVMPIYPNEKFINDKIEEDQDLL